MSDDIQTQATAPQKPDDERIAALAAKNAEILAEAKAAKERLRLYGAALGFDPAKQSPEEIAQSRAASQRESERRASAIERAVTRTLATSKPVPEPVFDLILSGAIASQQIKVGEDGAVTGAREYLDSVLAAMSTTAPAAPRPDAPQVPRPKLPAPDDVEPQYQGVTDFQSLLKMGPAAMSDYAQKYPQKYDLLKSAHFSSIRTPQRHIPPQAVGAR